MRFAVNLFMFTCLGFTVLQYGSTLIWASLSGRLLDRERSGNRDLALQKIKVDPGAPGVSIIMPAYNEEAVITHTVLSALDQEYVNVEVIVVNDGSKDRTMEVMIEAFDMVPFETSPESVPIPTKEIFAIYRSQTNPQIVLIDKAGSGAKADNSNVGVNFATFDWVVVMDADEFMELDVIARCMAEVVELGDEVVGVGTSLLPANDIVIDGSKIVDREASRNYWVGCQLIEYLTAFLVARPGLAHIGALPIISGGFGLFKRDAVLAADGYAHGHLGEDMDVCLKIHRAEADAGRPYRIVQVPEAIVWTEFPNVKSILERQRIRWHRGLKVIMDDHGDMIRKRRYGNVGRVGMASLYVFEWIGPILEGVGWILMFLLLALGWIDPLNALAVFLTTQLIGMALTTIGVLIAVTRLNVYRRPSDLKRMLLFSLAVNWGYRQLTLWWRLRSLLPGETVWGEMPRAGFKTVQTT